MFGHNQDEIIALIGKGIGAKVDIARNWSIQAGFCLTGPSNDRFITKSPVCRHIEDIVCSTNTGSGGGTGCTVGKIAIAFSASL